MARAPKKETKQEPLEVVLWKTADKLRKNIDAAEYKHVVLGLIFLKYISDTFEAHYNLLVEGGLNHHHHPKSCWHPKVCHLH